MTDASFVTMKKNNLLLVGLIAVILGAGVGIHYRIPIVIALVCLGLAVFCAVVGVRMIVTRKAQIPTSESFDPHREYHTGLSAQFWGVLFLVFSVPVGAFGVLYLMYGDNPPSDIVQRMAESPLISGVVIFTVGASLVMYGLTRVLPGKQAFVETGIGRFERGVTAVFSCTAGALIAVAGIVRVLAPGALTRMRDAVIAWALGFVK